MKLLKQSFGCFSCCLNAIVGLCLLFAGFPVLLFATTIASMHLQEAYENGEADWAGPVVRELKYWDEVWEEASKLPPPCTANHCRDNEAIAEADSALFFHFPFLRGNATNIYSWEINYFQGSNFDYHRFDISPEMFLRILHSSDVEQVDECSDRFIQDTIRRWWQAGELEDRVCYSGHSSGTRAFLYDLLYSPQSQTAYFRAELP